MSAPDAVADYPGIHIEFFEKPHKYMLNGERAVSVTQALGIIDKSRSLMYYAERVTAEGMRTLARRKGYRFPDDMKVPEGARGFRLPKYVDNDPTNGVWLFKWSDVDKLSKSDPKSLIRIGKGWRTLTGTRIALGHLAQLRLDHHSQTESAGERGVDVHAVLEEWIEQHKIPNVSEHPKNTHGYIRALGKWLVKWSPTFCESEMMVGSAVHGFAGRRDTVATVDVASLPASVTSAPNFPEAAKAGGRLLLDLKTSKGIYGNSHFPQLAAYELAGVECGGESTVAQGIVQLGENGEFDVGWSNATADDFLCVLAAWKSQQKWKRRYDG